MTDGASPHLVGRVEELERALDLASRRSCSAVVLTGVAGAGKSMLAEAIVGELEGAGWTGVTLSATDARGTVPFSSVSDLIPDVLDTIVDPYGDGERLAAQRGIEAALGLDDGKQPVVVINEPAAIDQSTCDILVHLAANERIFIVACQRPGNGLDDAVRRLAPASPQIIELAPLDFGETAELATLMFGSPVAPGLSRSLFHRSQGHPAFIRDLVESALVNNRVRLVGGIHQLTGEIEISPELARQIIAGIGLLSADEQAVMETLALGGTLGVDDLTSVAPISVLETMEQRGLIATETSQRRLRVSLTHPLHSEALAANMTPLSLRSRRQQILRLLGDRPRRRERDRLLHLRLSIDVGADTDPDELVDATYAAFKADRIDDGATFAEAAHNQAPSEATLAAVAESLVRLGRFVEADEIIQQAAPPADDWAMARRAIRRSSNVFWGFGDTATALAIDAACIKDITDPHAIERVRAHEAWIDYCDGYSQRALDRLDALTAIDDPTIDVDVRFALAVARAPALILTDAVDDGAALAERAWDQGWGADTEFGSRGQHLIALGHGLLLSGNLEGARFVTEMAIAGCRERSETPPLLFFLDLAGWIELYSGNVDRALAHHEEAGEIAAELSLSAARRVSTANVVICHAHRGDHQAAESAWRTLADMPKVPGPRADTEVRWAEGWTAAVGGDLGRAREVLSNAGADCRARGLLTLEALTLFDMARLGLIEHENSERANKLGLEMQGGLLPLLCRGVEAVSEGDAGKLDQLASELEQLGFGLWAAELAAMASDQWSAAGDQRAATASQHRSDRIRRSLGTVRTPALARRQSVEPLTKREREIASLAAAGSSNADIAERLVVSIRTVETHLGNIYRKLGVGGRRELADAINLGSSPSR